MIGVKMKIKIQDNIQHLSQSTIFSYKEVYILSQFIDAEKLEICLNVIVCYGMSVGEFLITIIGIPQEIVYEMLHEEVEYV